MMQWGVLILQAMARREIQYFFTSNYSHLEVLEAVALYDATHHEGSPSSTAAVKVQALTQPLNVIGKARVTSLETEIFIEIHYCM